MRSSSKRTGSRTGAVAGRVKALPWAALARVGVLVGQRWNALSQKDRARLAELVRRSHGRVGSLSSGERKELRKLVGKLDLKGAGREILPLVRGGRSRKRR